MYIHTRKHPRDSSLQNLTYIQAVVHVCMYVQAHTCMYLHMHAVDNPTVKKAPYTHAVVNVFM